jgi:selenide,water dikinase
MRDMRVSYDKNVIVGMDTGDDAGVYRISDSEALIQTVDFITPVVDDPFTFGRIAACNSLSDVYAMGGRPITALNIVCFPTKKFTLDILQEIIRGGLDAMEEAETQLVGGHSVDDPELKYGLSVTGVVRTDRVVRNNALRHGDAVILTKPLGTGVIATAVKAGVADGAVMGPFIGSMAALNKYASEIMMKHGVHACTDVTGFGLIGHLGEMLGDKTMEIVVDSRSLPVLPGAREAARNGFIPGGMYRNREFIGGICSPDSSVPQDLLDICHDPQTSGGLLIAVDGKSAAELIAGLHAGGVAAAAIIASVAESQSQRIVIK